MKKENSILVNYTKIQIDPKSSIYYFPDTYWAEPDIYDAAEKMSRIYSDDEYRKEISINAKKFIEEQYNIKICADDFYSKLIDKFNMIDNNQLFNWIQYVNKYEDLMNANINTKEKAYQHWFTYGKKEGRTWK